MDIGWNNAQGVPATLASGTRAHAGHCGVSVGQPQRMCQHPTRSSATRNSRNFRRLV